METKKRSVSKPKDSQGGVWIYKGKNFLTQPEDMYGFVYLITNKLDRRIYVGKKCFSFRKKKKIAQKVIKTTKTRKRVEITYTDSGWANYFGSSKALSEDVKTLGKENFSREILCFSKNKSELSYMEVVNQINYKVLEVPSYNGWISCKIYKSKI